MITSCKLVGYDSKNKNLLDIELLLTNTKGEQKKQVLKNGQHFAVHTYMFIVHSTEYLDRVYLELNELERFSLHNMYSPIIEVEQNEFELYQPLVEPVQKYHEYQSERISSAGFLRFNIGVYDFSLVMKEANGDISSKRLKLLRNEQPLLDDVALKHVYDHILQSQFFDIFLDGLRGNSKFDPAETAVDSSSFWIRRFIVKRFLIEISRLLSKNERLITNALELSKISQYTPSTNLQGQDIEWLARHPESLDEASHGDFELHRRVFKINLVQQSRTDIHYDNFENRLILSCLQSMAEFFEADALASDNDVWVLSDLSSDISTDVNDQMFELAQLYNLAPPFTEIPSFSHTFFDDPFYSKIFRYISDWYDLKEMVPGNNVIAPIPAIPKIWEYYCIAEITNTFLADDFVVTDTKYSKTGTLIVFTLSRGNDESIEIYYEPTIKHETTGIPITSTAPGSYEPDFLIFYRANGYEKVGIIDAKFTSSDYIEKWSKEIYGKYGLYLCKHNGLSIDYVVSLYPGTKSDVQVLKNYRRGLHAHTISPYLGIMSLPVGDEGIHSFNESLQSLVGTQNFMESVFDA